MKKIILILSFFAAMHLHAADEIYTRNSAGKMKVTGVQIVTNTIVTTNSVLSHAVSGKTTSAGAADSGQVVKLNALGKVDSTMFSPSSVVTTNIVGAVGSASADTWTRILSITTTATNGTVLVQAFAGIETLAGTENQIRITDNTSTFIGGSSYYLNATPGAMSTYGIDTLSGSAKTYWLEVSSGAGSQLYTNIISAPAMTNALGMKILQTP